MGNIYNSTLPRKTPLRAKKGFTKKPYKWKAGKKTKEWNSARKELKNEFLAMGITSCELGFEGCWRDNGLGFAHKMKRRFIKTNDELKECILACAICHDKIESMSHEAMKSIVETIIENRRK